MNDPVQALRELCRQVRVAIYLTDQHANVAHGALLNHAITSMMSQNVQEGKALSLTNQDLFAPTLLTKNCPKQTSGSFRMIETLVKCEASSKYSLCTFQSA
jgi:hypothetical protein